MRTSLSLDGFITIRALCDTRRLSTFAGFIWAVNPKRLQQNAPSNHLHRIYPHRSPSIVLPPSHYTTILWSSCTASVLCTPNTLLWFKTVLKLRVQENVSRNRVCCAYYNYNRSSISNATELLVMSRTVSTLNTANIYQHVKDNNVVFCGCEKQRNVVQQNRAFA